MPISVETLVIRWSGLPESRGEGWGGRARRHGWVAGQPQL